MKDLIKVLIEKGINYVVENNTVIITENNGHVYLPNLTEITTNVKFENNGDVYLPNLTEITTNVKFENNGGVDLSNLTEITTDIKFENNGDINLRNLTEITTDIKFENNGTVYLQNLREITTNVIFNNSGHVYLENLTEITTNIKFENKGHVYLSNLKEITTNVIFNNSGYADLENLIKISAKTSFNNNGRVYLENLKSETQTYKGKQIRLIHVDGFTMLIENEHKIDDYIIYNARYFGGGDIDKLKQVFVAKKGKYYAHGKTIKQAIADVNFKFLQETFDLDDIVNKIKEKQTVNVAEYRLLTGACLTGVQNFLDENNIKVDELPLTEVMKITEGQYGYEKIIELFN